MILNQVRNGLSRGVLWNQEAKGGAIAWEDLGADACSGEFTMNAPFTVPLFILDNSIRLRLPDGTQSPRNFASDEAWDNGGTVETSVYGNDKELWGCRLTPEIVNHPNFGFGIQIVSDQEASWQAYIYKLDFQIPKFSKILGIRCSYTHKWDTLGDNLPRVDCLSVQVFYQPFGPGPTLFSKVKKLKRKV